MSYYDYQDYGEDYGGAYDDDSNEGVQGDSDKDSVNEWKLGDGLGSYKDRQRAGGSINTCWVTGIDGLPLKTQTPLGRFCVRVNAIARGIKDACNMSEEDIELLLERSQRLNRVRYKNPTAFVLGFLATRGGMTSVNKESLKTAWGCYCERACNSNKNSCYASCVKSSIGFKGDESEKPVQKPDIIRYARLWVPPE